MKKRSDTRRKGPRLISVKRIWDHAPHNAMTDLIRFQNRFLCCFREGQFHVGGEDGKIRILESKDAVDWHSIALIEKSGVDLRDPHFAEMPDGRLMLIMGGSIYREDNLIACTPHVTFSMNGEDWSELIDTKMNNEWIWQVAWNKGVGYGISYRQTDLADIKKPWLLTLFRTQDGKQFEAVSSLDVSSHPSESVIRFTENDVMVALVRRRGNAWIGFASPPYTLWNWMDTHQRVGGPNFLILPDKTIWVCSRLYRRNRNKLVFYTGLSQLKGDVLEPVLSFPSGGDTSYPGMVFFGDKLYTSYYSSHEGKAMIYLAIIH